MDDEMTEEEAVAFWLQLHEAIGGGWLKPRLAVTHAEAAVALADAVALMVFADWLEENGGCLAEPFVARCREAAADGEFFNQSKFKQWDALHWRVGGKESNVGKQLGSYV